MTWAKLDDRFDDHRKVKRVWLACPQALGLHVMALTYCTRHETDGLVDREYVAEKAPATKKRDAMTSALVTAGLWDEDPDGWRIHDFLDYNPSRADLDEKRRRDAERKARGRDTQSAGRPGGFRAESERIPDGVQSVSGGPVPARPVHPPTEDDGRPRGREETDALPPDLPTALTATATATHHRLSRVAAAKKAKPPTLAATGRVVADFPDHDHQRLAGEFEHYWVHGAGAKVVRRDIVLTYRRRLEHVTPGSGPPRQGESLHELADRMNKAQAAA